ncbi:MAG: radical SAM protein [Spirochaetales bacterium]|nr:radical SAM protein [Spirochaetales bacterium]
MHNLLNWLKNCRVCPNFCGVDRTKGKKGTCRVADDLIVSSASLHFGEEPVLVGRGGSGTIFFTSCNLHCIYCQNYDISQLDYGSKIAKEDLVSLMLMLQKRRAENINLVTPTHQAPQIFACLVEAKKQGLKLPIVYNCGGYENPEFLKELEGSVDIYMPDVKYASDESGELYSGIKAYASWNRKALQEMQRQVGSLVINSRGVAEKGLLVRHLVLPHGKAGSREVMDFIAEHISRKTYINIMDQYHPSYRAQEYRELSRRVFRQEVDEVVKYAKSKGLNRILY